MKKVRDLDCGYGRVFYELLVREAAVGALAVHSYTRSRPGSRQKSRAHIKSMCVMSRREICSKFL